LSVEPYWTSASAAPASTMIAVGGLFGDDRGYTSGSQVSSVGARGVRLITQHRLWPGPWPTAAGTWHPQLAHQHLEHRRIMGMARTDEHHQRQPVPVAEVVDLCAQSAARTAQTMISGFRTQIRVIRPCPLCGAPRSRRADGPGRSSNPPPPTNRHGLRHPRWSTTPSRWHPRCHQQ